MKYIADLHIHSRFSRATAKTLDFPRLYMAARQKGITVVATGDFTHPAWLAEIGRYLEPAEPGLFRLKPELEKECEKQISVTGCDPVRFILSTEISNIYKKGGITRKLHHVVFFPELSHVEAFNARLSRIGNLKADGRPILGLDSKNLLEIVLETHEAGFLVPAHIWTPWFSLFGSRSGFDSVAECFEELAGHIFAVETGLSSDPPMNWRVTDLDNRTLVSNSDAHSPANLGREANIFNTDLSYFSMREAMETGDPEKFLGTLEFFPEEGKYHQDGHRKCGVNLHPRQTMENNGICPVCGAPVTVGVLYRVEQLAGRKEGEKPEKTHPFHSLIPLAEILSELLGVGAKSKKVAHAWQAVIGRLGPELRVLYEIPVEKIRASGNPLLAEAIGRMRAGRVYRRPGYDGAYGRVTLFTDQERDRLAGQKALFDTPRPGSGKQPAKAGAGRMDHDAETAPGGQGDCTGKTPAPGGSGTDCPTGLPDPGDPARKSLPESQNPVLAGLNEAQRRAVTHPAGPLLISAGPGTGKTRTLTCRIAYLILQGIAAPEQVLAVTFTNKAAGQMRDRLGVLLGSGTRLPAVQTFHAFCFFLLRELESAADHAIADEEDRRVLLAEALDRVKARGEKISLRADFLENRIAAAKQRLLSPEDDLAEVAGEHAPVLAPVYGEYQHLLETEGLYDYEDLVCRTVMHLEADPAICEKVRRRFAFVFIDEYQDINYAQYRLIRQLCPEDGHICAIGDPEQSIYGFRGSDPAYFQKFMQDYPGAEAVRLSRSYRSTETILAAAARVIGGRPSNGGRPGPIRSGISGTPHVHLISAESEQAEAVAVGKRIEQMVGGMGFDFYDFDKGGQGGVVGQPSPEPGAERSFADFAVLFRTRAQGEVFAEVFARAGIPFQRAAKAEAWEMPGVAEIISALKIIEGRAAYRDLQRLIRVIVPAFSAPDMAALKSWGRGRGLPANGLLAETRRLGANGLSSAGHGCLEDFLGRIEALGKKLTAADGVREKLEIVNQALLPLLPDPGPARQEAFEELKNLAASFGPDTFGFLETLALHSDADFVRPEAEKVALLTMHAAKGLEFPVVFVAGCEQDLIPYAGSALQEADPEEERRLFYVAVTRAMEELFLSFAKTRRIHGITRRQKPSAFLSDIPENLKRTDNGAPWRKKAKPVQRTLFPE